MRPFVRIERGDPETAHEPQRSDDKPGLGFQVEHDLAHVRVGSIDHVEIGKAGNGHAEEGFRSFALAPIIVDRPAAGSNHVDLPEELGDAVSGRQDDRIDLKTVVATGRDIDRTRAAFDKSHSLLVTALDVTDESQIKRAVAEALERFDTIDVLVNNAGYGHLGFFEETTRADAEAQFATNVHGVFNVTRAVLPTMRRQRDGRIFNISSIGGVRGGSGYALYAASKFALEGFSEALAAEVACFGIRVTIVQPGYFRTDFLTPESIRSGEASIEDYAEVSSAMREVYTSYNHQQLGDPSKLADAIVRLAGEAAPPLRYAAGRDAYDIVVEKAAELAAGVEQWRDLSLSIDGTF